MIRFLLCIVIATALVTGCNRNSARNAGTERELPFKASLDKGEDPRDIEVKVAHKGADLDALRESVRFEATKYCLLNFGGSEADWQIDPATDDWAFRADGDSAYVFSARCTAR